MFFSLHLVTVTMEELQMEMGEVLLVLLKLDGLALLEILLIQVYVQISEEMEK